MAKKCSFTYPCALPTLRVKSSIRLVEGLWYGVLLHNVLILLLMSLYSSNSLQAQIFTDDFENGRFDQGALWYGDTSLFFLQKHPIQKRHQIPLSNEQSVLMSQGTQFGLKKESDQRFLLMDSLVIDSIFYHQEWHNPNLYDTKRIALERIDTNPSQRSSRNWSSSVDPSGGTPLKLNSIEQLKQPAASPTPSVYFEPNPFSPNFDEYEDVTYLHYQYTSPDYLIRIWIFDRYGRQIVQLSQRHTAGTRGALMWDELNENGQKVPIGRYIAYIEASDAAGRSVQRHTTTVIVAR